MKGSSEAVVEQDSRLLHSMLNLPFEMLPDQSNVPLLLLPGRDVREITKGTSC